MPQAPSIESLRAGRHVDSNGVEVEFSAADLKAIAQAYDPSVYEAPMVVGHPKLDAPAYGWVASFKVNDAGVLCAEPNDQTEPQFAEMVNAGRFKRVSLALYPPKHPSNPKPGTWYPKHVGFLGAHAPAIKGLKSVQFGDDDGLVVLGSWEAGTVAQLFRSVREWLIGEKSLEVADKVLPSWQLDSLQRAATEEALQEDVQTAFNEQGDDMSDKEKAAELQAQLDAANKALKERDDQIAADKAAKAKADADKRHADAVAFSEKLVGKLPAERLPLVVKIVDILATPGADGTVLQFGEGTEKKPLVDEVRSLFEALPNNVEFGEVAKRRASGDNDDDLDDEVQFAEGVDPARIELDRKAKAYAKKHNVSYQQALDSVVRKS